MESESNQTNFPANCQEADDKTTSKVDPSFKSKRYRDKLRTEIKALESQLPVDKTVLHRKLDSQTVFRLVISFFRMKAFFKAARFGESSVQANSTGGEKHVKESNQTGCQSNEKLFHQLIDNQTLLQLLDGFLLVATSDGTILYVSQSIVQNLGFNQIDLMHRCIYGIVHPDDHQDLKSVLEHTFSSGRYEEKAQGSSCCHQPQSGHQTNTPREVSFLSRMKCFNGTATGYLKIHGSGHMYSLSNTVKSTRTSSQVLFAYCRPFMMSNMDPSSDAKQNVFWSKHEMDLTFKQLDKKSADVIGYSSDEMEGKSFYSLVHPEDLPTCTNCHKAFTESHEIQTMYFRLIAKDGKWIWLHTRGKVVFKNAKKYSVVFSHCPVREEDSTYIQQEIVLRQRYAMNDLMFNTSFQQYREQVDYRQDFQQSSRMAVRGQSNRYHPYGGLREDTSTSLHSPHGICPSSWHSTSERHSPVFPSTHMPHKYFQQERRLQFEEMKKYYAEREIVSKKYAGITSHEGPMVQDRYGQQYRHQTPHFNTWYVSPRSYSVPHYQEHMHQTSFAQDMNQNHTITNPQFNTVSNCQRWPSVPIIMPLSPPPSPKYPLKAESGYSCQNPCDKQPYEVSYRQPSWQNCDPRVQVASDMQQEIHPSTSNPERHQLHNGQYPQYIFNQSVPVYQNQHQPGNPPNAAVSLGAGNIEYTDQALMVGNQMHMVPATREQYEINENSHIVVPNENLQSQPVFFQQGPTRIVTHWHNPQPTPLYHNETTENGHTTIQITAASCAWVQTGPNKPTQHVDADMTGHMKIVDNGSGNASTTAGYRQSNVELPSVGSLLEYLNEV